MRPRPAHARSRRGRRRRHRAAGHEPRGVAPSSSAATPIRPRTTAAGHADTRTSQRGPAGGGASAPRVAARQGSGRGGAAGHVASPRQLDAPARRARADVPLAAAGARERARERRRERHQVASASTRAIAVGATPCTRPPANATPASSLERRLAPPPVVGERGAPVLLRVRAGAVQRPVAEVALHARTEQPRGPVLARARGTDCAGPSGPNARRGQSRRSVSRTESPGPRSTCSDSASARNGPATTPRPSGSARASTISVCTKLPGSRRQRDHRPVAADAGDRDHAPAVAGEAPVVALEAQRPSAYRASQRPSPHLQRILAGPARRCRSAAAAHVQPVCIRRPQ